MMQPDMMPELQQQAAQLGQLTRDLVAATPQRSEGSDATGCVWIALGPDGLPTEIRIRDGWRQRLEPGRLGAAVLDANTDAVQRAMQAWTAGLDDNRWWRRRADVDMSASEQAAPSVLEPPEPPLGRASDGNQLAEQVLTALQTAQRQPIAAATPQEGMDDGRHATVEIGPGGLTACTIDPDWAAHRDGGSIGAALSAALDRAIAKRPTGSSPGVEIDGLLGDALATLVSLAPAPTTQDGD